MFETSKNSILKYMQQDYIFNILQSEYKTTKK